LTEVSSIAVNGFFVLSGFLIAGSRMRLGFGRYLWHRTLRIMPAFWVSLVVVALVFAPVAAVMSGETWQLSSSLTYIHVNLFLDIQQWGIDDTLQHVPFVDAWNGSLWTLEFEFLAYLVAGLVLTSRLVRKHLKLVLCLVTILTGSAIALAEGPLDVGSYFGFNSLRLGASFAAGMTLWAFRDSLPRTSTLTAVAGAVSCALYFATPTFMYALAPLPLGYFVLSLGGGRRIRLGSTNDISYGSYIYAFPVQQLLAVLGGHRLGYLGFFAVGLVITAPLAWLSWRLVERPFLRFKNARVDRSHATGAKIGEREANVALNSVRAS
jgi:peptidoglycan/LPS O-acetylase OafA/YrhL